MNDRPAPPETTTWRPIETAPRDGTEILVRDPDGIAVAAWHDDQSEWPWSEHGPGFYVRRQGAWDIYDSFAPQCVFNPKSWAPIPE